MFSWSDPREREAWLRRVPRQDGGERGSHSSWYDSPLFRNISQLLNVSAKQMAVVPSRTEVVVFSIGKAPLLSLPVNPLLCSRRELHRQCLRHWEGPEGPAQLSGRGEALAGPRVPHHLRHRQTLHAAPEGRHLALSSQLPPGSGQLR